MGPRAREISARDRERLFFLMAQMLRSGQTTEGSLRAVAKAFRSEKKDDISAGLNAIAQKVSQGRPLSRAMEYEYGMFGDIHRAAILAGETANNMQQAFQTLQELEQKKIEASRTGMAEIITPAALLCLSFASLLNSGINTLPVLSTLKKQQGKELGILPTTVMEFANLIADNWYMIFAGFIIAIIVGYSLLKSTQGRYWLDAYTLRMPLLGKFIALKTYSSMLLYFPHLIAAGVKPKQMIPIMEALASNALLRRRIDLFNQAITTGGQMSTAMERAGFPSIAVTPVAVSEHYSGADDGVNDVMIEGMKHSYSIIERDLDDTQRRFINTVATILWLGGGCIMLMEMMSIIMAQT